MIINWFSPLPPSKSGIASFTRLLLPELSSRAELRIWSSQEIVQTQLGQYGQLVHFKPGYLNNQQEVLLQEADFNFYNLGNNVEHHGDIFDLFLLYPGHAIVHDAILRDLFRSHLLTRYSPAHLHSLVEFYFQNERATINKRIDARWKKLIDEGGTHMPKTLRSKAHGIFVHTDAGQKVFPEAVRLNLAYPALPPRHRPKDRHPPHPVLLFSYFNAVRPVTPILEALAAFPRRDKIHLHIAGEFCRFTPDQGEPAVRKAIEDLQLGNQVSLHGFVSDSRLEELLDHCELALNLRTKSHGEASFGQLQIWAHSLPSVVSDVGWFQEWPGDLAMKIDMNDLQSGLHDAWERLIARDPLLQQQGQKGNAFLRQKHHPSAYVDALLSAR